MLREEIKQIIDINMNRQYHMGKSRKELVLPWIMNTAWGNLRRIIDITMYNMTLHGEIKDYHMQHGDMSL